MKKQSLISKLLTGMLCLIFHSKYERSSERSNDLSKTLNRRDGRSFFKPIGRKPMRYGLDDFYMELTEPKRTESKKVIFHIHGGSFKLKMNDIYRREAAFYSRFFGECRVFSVDYRVFPEVKYPTPLDDVYKAYVHLLTQENISPDDIIVIGDSCGANMAASLCLKLKDSKMPLPSFLVLFSFWGDLSNSGASYRENCYRDPFYGIPKKLTYDECASQLRRITLYARGNDLLDPYLSPCCGDFSGFPETVLVTGSADISQSDSYSAYEKMNNVGVKVHLLDYDNMFHDFQLIKFLPETKEVFRAIKSILNAV